MSLAAGTAAIQPHTSSQTFSMAALLSLSSAACSCCPVNTMYTCGSHFLQSLSRAALTLGCCLQLCLQLAAMLLLAADILAVSGRTN